MPSSDLWYSRKLNLEFFPSEIKFLLFIIILTNSCTNAQNGAINIPSPEPPITYNISEKMGTQHRYRENIFDLDLPMDNHKLTQYCLIHERTENITVVVKSNGYTEYKVRKI